jgi:hypothetical protein
MASSKFFSWRTNAIAPWHFRSPARRWIISEFHPEQPCCSRMGRTPPKWSADRVEDSTGDEPSSASATHFKSPTLVFCLS